MSIITHSNTTPTTPETSIVFLDIDGVIYKEPRGNKVRIKAQELFPHVEGNLFNDHQSSIAAAYFFDSQAIANLNRLIQTVKDVAIVISSDWRINTTTAQLKERLAIHYFSNYIIDMTTEIFNKEYGNYSEQEGISGHAGEIAFWLKKNPHTKFVIYDDSYVDKLKKRFPNNFIQVDPKKLLTQEDTEKAFEILGVKV